MDNPNRQRYGHQKSLEVPEALYDIMLDMCDGDPDEVVHCASRCLAEGLERINRVMQVYGHRNRTERYLRATAKFKRGWCSWYAENILEQDNGE